MNEIQSAITGGFWRERLDLNQEKALAHQWSMLEQSGCINNFRITAKEKEGFREGFFFSDSDAYKWLEAACTSLADRENPVLSQQVEDFVTLLEHAQDRDGYLFTYNQVHFPGKRWVNSQIEHEQYCLGHLIEAGIAHAQTTGSGRLLSIARRAADLLVKDLMTAPPVLVDGHAELEIALLRLSDFCDDPAYRELSRQLLARRGHIPLFSFEIIRQSISSTLRGLQRADQRKTYKKTHPLHDIPRFTSRLVRLVPPFMQARWLASLLSGRFTQQNLPVREQREAVGHAVRFLYLEAAQTRLAHQDNEKDLLSGQEKIWEGMVRRRMYVTGGIGSLPLVEGFGRDYELNPEIAYAETCAAVASMRWCWQLQLATGKARYADLFEWQLYNAASVSMSVDGTRYFYDNPLACRRGLTRERWYDVPCCPSNLSRTWAGLRGNLYTQEMGRLWVHQYISSQIKIPGGVTLSMESGFPWEGKVRIRIENGGLDDMHFRIPAWADGCTIHLNQALIQKEKSAKTIPATACGYDPDLSRYFSIKKPIKTGDYLELDFGMSIRFYHQDRRVPLVGGKIAVGRGPLVYCMEGIDNPELDLFNVTIGGDTFEPVHCDSLGGYIQLQGKSKNGDPVILIPYMLWGNRGQSQMNVFMQVSE